MKVSGAPIGSGCLGIAAIERRLKGIGADPAVAGDDQVSACTGPLGQIGVSNGLDRIGDNLVWFRSRGRVIWRSAGTSQSPDPPSEIW